MDPLSIAASSASLALGAMKISRLLYEAVETTKRADTSLSELGNEVTTLTNLLTSLDKTIQECRKQPLALVYIGEEIWTQLASAVADCSSTVGSLEMLLSSIRESSGMKKIFRRPNIAVWLSFHAGEIATFRNMIHTSNCAIQMGMAMVTVSLSIRNNTSQDRIFKELKMLRSFIRQALETADDPSSMTEPRAAHASKWLHQLARAAEVFHSNASSTASTVRGAGSTTVPSSSMWGGSVMGDLPESKLLQIRKWQQSSLDLANVESEPSTNDTSDFWTPSTGSKTSLYSPVTETGGDVDSDLELDLVQSFEQLAAESFKSGEYAKAEQYLNKIMSRSAGSPHADETLRSLQTRLATCHCSRGQWDSAAKVLTIARADQLNDPAVYHLLHGVSIAYCEIGRFEEAERICKMTLHGKRKIWGKSSVEYCHTLSLLVRICEHKGDSLEAEAVRRAITRPALDFSTRDDLISMEYFYQDTYLTLLETVWAINDSTDRHPGQRSQSGSSQNTTSSPQNPRVGSLPSRNSPLTSENLGNQRIASQTVPESPSPPRRPPEVFPFRRFKSFEDATEPTGESSDADALFSKPRRMLDAASSISLDFHPFPSWYGKYVYRCQTPSPVRVAPEKHSTDTFKEVVGQDTSRDFTQVQVIDSLPSPEICRGRFYDWESMGGVHASLVDDKQYMRFVEHCQNSPRASASTGNSTDTFKEVAEQCRRVPQHSAAPYPPILAELHRPILAEPRGPFPPQPCHSVLHHNTIVASHPVSDEGSLMEILRYAKYLEDSQRIVVREFSSRDNPIDTFKEVAQEPTTGLRTI